MRLFLFLTFALLGLSTSVRAVPGPEILLPMDTIAMVSIPDFNRAEAAFDGGPIGRLWNDRVLRSFRKKFTDKFEKDYLATLEQTLALDFDLFEDLPRGQLTLAMVGGLGQNVRPPSLLVIMDAGKKNFTLRRTLSRMERDWKKTGWTVQDVKLAGENFVSVNTGQTESMLETFVAGRVSGILIAATDMSVAVQIVQKLGGRPLPRLERHPVFATDHREILTDADAYAWVNLEAIVGRLVEMIPEFGEESLIPLDSSTILQGMGVQGLTSITAAMRERPEGIHMELFLGAPKERRGGLLNVFQMSPADTSPPPFVPANVTSFARARADLGSTWKRLEALIREQSPSTANIMQSFFELLGKDKNAGFDFRKSFFGNLGDDTMMWQFTSREGFAGPGNIPWLALVESPNPQQLIRAMDAIPGLLPPPLHEATLEEIILGGHKVFTGKLAELELVFAVKGQFMAFSNDKLTLLSFLNGEPDTALINLPSLGEAARQVGGMESGFFGLQNDRAVILDTLRTLKANAGTGSLLQAIPLAQVVGELFPVDLNEMFDTTLLPAPEKVARYFSFTVFASTIGPRGYRLKLFRPTPQDLN